MKIKNLEKFEKWLKEKSKYEIYNINEYLEEVEMQTGINGSETYELSKGMTKSGFPETYDLKIETEINEDTGEILYTYIF